MTPILPVELPAALLIAAKFLVVALFGVALRGKLANWAEFVAVVARYPLVPYALAKLVAIAVAALEAGCIILILYPPLAPVGGALAIGLLLAFAGGMTIAYLRGDREMDCGCNLGGSTQHISWLLIVRNVVLAALILPALAAASAPSTLLDWVDGLGFGLIALLISMIAARLGQLGEFTDAFQRRFA